MVALCPHNIPSDTIEPRMLRLFMDKVVTHQYTINAKEALLATLMHKVSLNRPKIHTIPLLTTGDTVSKTSHSPVWGSIQTFKHH